MLVKVTKTDYNTAADFQEFEEKYILGKVFDATDDGAYAGYVRLTLTKEATRHNPNGKAYWYIGRGCVKEHTPLAIIKERLNVRPK